MNTLEVASGLSTAMLFFIWWRLGSLLTEAERITNALYASRKRLEDLQIIVLNPPPRKDPQS